MVTEVFVVSDCMLGAFRGVAGVQEVAPVAQGCNSVGMPAFAQHCAASLCRRPAAAQSCTAQTQHAAQAEESGDNVAGRAQPLTDRPGCQMPSPPTEPCRVTARAWVGCCHQGLKSSHEGACAVAASAAHRAGVHAAGRHRVVVAERELGLLFVVACKQQPSPSVSNRHHSPWQALPCDRAFICAVTEASCCQPEESL